MQILYYKTVQLWYCDSADYLLKNAPGTLLSHCISYTTKRSSYCIVTVQFPYYKTSSYCIVTVQFPYHKTFQVLYCYITDPIKQFLPFSLLSHYSYYATKKSSYCISTVQILYHKMVQFCIVTVQFLYKKVLVTVLSQYNSYTTNRSSYCIVTFNFL